ncbi:MAG: fumarylacetoacetate hydrolase family protein [Xanthomonadales bacterium]|nr:fumarylacetoacetate hydrolase family protein [Xanthomonadales bacterium]
MPVETWSFPPLPRPSLTVAGEEARFPVHRIYCVGRNYAAHAREMGHDDREQPCFFSKPADAVVQGPLVAWPPATKELHHEVELVVALGRGGAHIVRNEALDHVFGYAVGVDLTRRDLQAEAKRAGRPWDVAKGFDQSAPISELRRVAQTGHPDRGCIELAVNGQTRQHGDLGDMIWPVADIIVGLSAYFTLMPGDLIFTGTPEGVGPLDPGSRVAARIEGIAQLQFQMTGHD